MRFLFVDRITELDQRKVKGTKRFAAGAPMQYEASEISPAAVSEAVGQLVSWLCLKNNAFQARPVFLFADRIAISGIVRPGDEIELSAWICAQDDQETFVFSGEAAVNGEIVHSIERCHGYFMPLGDLEDPAVCEQRFAALMSGGLDLSGDSGPYPFATLVGDTVEETPGERIVTRKTMAPDERFYKDHFPRFPVTPIVMINEMIGQATARMLAAPVRPRLVEGIKIRNFVRPGETVETRISLGGQHTGEDGKSYVATTAEVVKDRKPILRGRYTYELL